MAKDGFYCRQQFNAQFQNDFHKNTTTWKNVQKFHILSKSDVYKPRMPELHWNSAYAGLVLYACHGVTHWTTSNGTTCSSGCIIILDTNSVKIRKCLYPGKESNVHDVVYECFFGEKMDKTLVAQGFSVKNDELKFNSLVFDCLEQYRDDKKEIIVTSQKYVKLVVHSWMNAGPSSLGKQEFDVWELDDLMNHQEEENLNERFLLFSIYAL